MEASYIMGSRLVIHNAAYEPIDTGSTFTTIQDNVRSHTKSFVDISVVGENHIDQTAFKDYEYNEGDDGEYIMYFPGGISYLDAVT